MKNRSRIHNICQHLYTAVHTHPK